MIRLRESSEACALDPVVVMLVDVTKREIGISASIALIKRNCSPNANVMKSDIFSAKENPPRVFFLDTVALRKKIRIKMILQY